ncbi:MAG: Gfo/Idh/MocA family oxidoreductase [Candidatus Alcyoniella australis]|nr:Gfo/Idh/MocA family oxidoreductase [Candidatus Alcyoniella australis]
MDRSKPLELVVIGAGARGELNLAWLAKRHRDAIKITGVVELDDERRECFIENYSIPRANALKDWRELEQAPRLGDAVINALPCPMHYESTMAALAAGYHVLLEKPMALHPGQSVKLVRAADERGLGLMVALQCRLNKIYTRVRELLDAGTIGRMMCIDCAENIGYWHFVMSYVRGIHHREDMSHSFLSAKGIHDLDLLNWFAGSRAKRISSFGELSFFNADNAPEGAPERCADGCPVQDECPFDAIKMFLKPGRPEIPLSLFSGMSLGALRDVATNPRFRTLASVIVRDISRKSVTKALEETIYGRCAFRCDNNVVDHQSVSIEYENGLTINYQLNGFSLIWERMLNLHGTKGEIRSADFSGRLETRTYLPGRVTKERIRYHGVIHGGGDEELLLQFADAVRNNTFDQHMLFGDGTLESHLLCFAAEQARKSGTVVDLEQFRAQAQHEADAL